MKKTVKFWIKVLMVTVLAVVLSSTAVLAAETGGETSAVTGGAGGRGSAVAVQDQGGETSEAVSDEDENIEFFDQLQTENRLADTVFIIGAILAFAGVGGFVCMFVWSRANKRRDRSEAIREDIFDEIEQAEIRNKKEKRRREQRAEREAEEPLRAADDLFDTQENDYFVAAPVKEQPIVPSTPVSMQPAETVRPRVQQPVQQVKPVQPVQPARPVQTAQPQPAVPVVRPTEPKPAAAPQPVQPAAPKAKYDLDDILREIREGKL